MRCETERVPDACTCGAKLPPDARFCHKCGKPQFDMPVYEREEETPPPPAASAPPPPPVLDVGFRNPIAVRIGALVALPGFFAVTLSGPIPLLPLIWLFAAGFLSVYLYRRRTGLVLSAGSGARMGWMTGLFAFLILLVLLTTVALAVSDPRIAAELLEGMRARGVELEAEHVVEAFQSFSGVVQIVLLSFIAFTLFPAIGGALGATLLSGPPRPPLP